MDVYLRSWHPLELQLSWLPMQDEIAEKIEEGLQFLLGRLEESIQPVLLRDYGSNIGSEFMRRWKEQAAKSLKESHSLPVGEQEDLWGICKGSIVPALNSMAVPQQTQDSIYSAACDELELLIGEERVHEQILDIFRGIAGESADQEKGTDR